MARSIKVSVLAAICFVSMGCMHRASGNGRTVLGFMYEGNAEMTSVAGDATESAASQWHATGPDTSFANSEAIKRAK